ncbi:Chitin-binding domain 3 [Pyrenophora tritici-repentis]|nr:Chitin-binding domain 3 [Pyrenophora tritici-repentis]KAG9378242.1 Chitin-binding domain 3 [Pyrenophora tritici-repentis]KAI0580933.1 Chitin-binding domain 3 [Pyrenophora tritici-repentis]KAI0585671.1 Chitin-binding domain 3 [Pyrenophora tritici-repentis]KAI0611218.1 Chitin-binding domain 3 [Pyrenophora tritici-repentis]
MKSFTVVAAIAGLATSVAAHGLVSSPTPRKPGAGLKAACGDQVFNTQNSDPYGNVQGSIQNLQGSHPDCKIWQCKGVPFADKTEVFQYTAGQKIDMKVEIHAPHDGLANVSVVSTSTDKIIGKPLISWDKYALTSVPMSQHPEWTSFSITMPDVSSECSKAGDCVIQWWWDAPTINQSYESCIDFTMGGGSGSSPATPVESSAPASSTTPEASATPTPSPAEPTASPAASPDVPKTFTIDTFVEWLRTNAGSSAAQKVRRMIAAQRPHPRAFAV